MAALEVEDKTTTQEVKEPAPPPVQKSLKETIRDAQVEAQKEENEGEGEKEPEKVAKKETSDSSKKEKETSDALETEQARQLYAALKDPERREGIIKFIAEQGGYTKATEVLTAKEQKQEVAEAKDEILEALKESLGSEFSFLAEKLSPAIGKIVNKEIAKSQADIREILEGQEQAKLEDQSSKTLVKLSEDFFGKDTELPDNVTKGMSAFMDKFPPTPDLGIQEYMEMVFFSTVGKLGLTKNSKGAAGKSSSDAAAEKIRKNATDASSRLASDRASSNTGRVVEDTSKIMTRKQAIEAAIESVSKGEVD